MMRALFLRLKISLKLVLIVPFVVLLVVTVALTDLVSFYHTQQSVRDMARELMIEVGSRVHLYLESYLETAHEINRCNTNAVRFGNLDPGNMAAVERYLSGQIYNYDNIPDILYANETGSFRVTDFHKGQRSVWVTDSPDIRKFQHYGINSQGERTQLLAEGEYPPDWDIRQRPWYRLAKQKQQPIWSPVYTLGDGTDLTINASSPVKDPNTQEFIGAFSVNLHLSQLNKFLQQVHLGKSGIVFLVEPDGHLIASSTNELPFRQMDNCTPEMVLCQGKFQRILATASQQPVIQAASQHLPSTNWQQGETTQEWEFQANEQIYFAVVQSYQDQYGLHWGIVTALPESDFMERVETHTRTNILLTLLAVMVAAGVGTVITNLIAEPILALNRITAAIADGNLNQSLTEEFPITELARLGRSFNLMAQQLRSAVGQLRENLQKSEANLEDIINSTIASIIRLKIFANGDWEIDFLSTGCQIVFGYNREEFLADKSIWMARIVPEDLENVILPVFADVFAEKTQLIEYRFYHKNGELRWISARLTSQYDAAANCWWVNQFAVDITDRKNAEIALQASEARYRAIVEDQTELIVRYHLDGTLNFVNDAYCRYFGISRDVFLGHHYSPVVFSEDQEHVQNLVNSMSRDNPVVIIENRVVVGGKIRWTQWVNRMIFDERGEFIEVQAVGRDIDDRKLAESALQVTLNRLQNLAKAVPGNLYSLVQHPDGSLEFEYTNRGVEDILEMSLDQILQDTASAIIGLIHPEDKEGYIAAVERSMATGETFKHQWRLIMPSGKIKWVQGNSQPERRDNGDIVWHGIVVDITETKLVETALQTAKEAAEAANRAKSEFLANMSHEIRTPMNAILGFCDLLDSRIIDPQKRSYLQAIMASGKTLLALINDILDLSKIEAGQVDIKYEPVFLKLLIKEVSQIFAHNAEQKSLSLSVNIPADFPPAILFDEVRLRQILFNVVGNAIKFTDSGGVTFTVTSHQPENSSDTINLELAISDTGIGIEAAQKERIFEAFIQSDGQSTRKYGGTGLGLAITKRLTQILGGTVTVESTPGQGSTFSFSFPGVKIANAVTTSVSSVDVEVNIDQMPPATILVIDDVQFNLDLIAGYFRRTKHHVMLASSGRVGINLAIAHQPDVILLDLWMPDMDGIETAKLLQENQQTRQIPIIVITASTRPSDEAAVAELGCTFLRKPVTKAQLLEAFKKLLPMAESRPNWPLDQPQPILAAASPPPMISTGDMGKTSTPETQDLWRKLEEKLHQEEKTNWPQLCQTMKQRELQSFAAQLQAWGVEYQYQPLLDYGLTLANQLGAFDWENLPKTLEKFPEIRQKLL
ncbi:MAG TPA: PAS domain S-box protein [Oscillatoriaceae cyanobacterium M33_DOE_052]|uniref:histidine kinase n=1 Tax=Planktothricoides sp. SpSt-374 TaxID=2282167 RepID=A0A7C3VJZ7_9CYAN|nr:PAS domain S-box protein [Oscillatoriaceae cyanobacterium M33_DOE_052]